jgi:hypothetical protein
LNRIPVSHARELCFEQRSNGIADGMTNKQQAIVLFDDYPGLAQSLPPGRDNIRHSRTLQRTALP